MACIPQSVLSAIAEQRDLVIEYQTHMTALRGLGPDNGGEGELAKALYLEKTLRDLGVASIQRIDAPDARASGGIRPNIAAQIPGRRSQTLWILGHMDVVPAGELSLWETDPWKVHVDGDKIIGRGVLDNQQSLTDALLIAGEILKQHTVPDLTPGFLFVSDEENGNHYGIDYVLKERPDLFAADDLVLVPDIGLPDGSGIEIAEKGQYWLRVTVHGVQCHASMPDTGKNPLIPASAMILSVQNTAKKFAQKNTLFDPPVSTFVPTRHEENVPNINTVAGQDVFYIDCRLLPEIDADAVLAEFWKTFADIAAYYGVKVTVDLVNSAPAAPVTAPQSAIVRRLQAAIQQIYHIDSYCYGAGGGTVAAAFRRHGLPAAAWASLVATPHIANEYTSIAKILGDAQVMATLLFDGVD